MAANAGGNDGLAGSHGFQQGYGKAFPQAGQDHQIAGGQQIADVLAKSQKRHPVRHTQIAGQTLQSGRARARRPR